MSLFRILARDDCTNAAGGDSCEKPAVSSAVTGIVIGVISGVLFVSLFIVLCIFQRRRTRRDNQEWNKNPQELEDYGMGSTTTIKTGNVKTPPQAHHQDRSGSNTDNNNAGAVNLGVPNNRISVDSTQALAQQLRQGEDAYHNNAAQVPRSLV